MTRFFGQMAAGGFGYVGGSRGPVLLIWLRALLIMIALLGPTAAPAWAAGSAVPPTATLNCTTPQSVSGTINGDAAATLSVTGISSGAVMSFTLTNQLSSNAAAIAQINDTTAGALVVSNPGIAPGVTISASYTVPSTVVTRVFAIQQTKPGNGHDVDWVATCPKQNQTINFTQPAAQVF